MYFYRLRKNDNAKYNRRENNCTIRGDNSEPTEADETIAAKNVLCSARGPLLLQTDVVGDSLCKSVLVSVSNTGLSSPFDDHMILATLEDKMATVQLIDVYRM